MNAADYCVFQTYM